MTRLIVGLGFAAVLLSLSTRALGDDVPRYALEPGMILDYEDLQFFRSPRGGLDESRRSRVWVVDRDEAGAARVVVRQVFRMKAPGAKDDAASASTWFSRFEIQPNGAISSAPLLGPRSDATDFFPRLPDTADEAAGDWRSRDDLDDITTTHRRIPSDERDGKSIFAFEADRFAARDKVYAGKNHRVFHFDRDRGLVVHSEISLFTSSRVSGDTTGTLELKSVDAMEPSELATFRREMDRCFDAMETHRALMREAARAGDGAEAVIAKAQAILADARAEATVPDAVAAFDHFDATAKHLAATAGRLAEFIGKPAQGWGPTESPKDRAPVDSEINDLEGRVQSLGQYRGKVLVLDFWYRHCGWCMWTMPQVKKLADHYREQPVAFFGMSNDEDEKDARFVVGAMKLEYPVIRSMDLPPRHGVQGFPTLVIIDQEGNIADIHVGYTPQLFERISETIDRLLKPAE